MAKAKDESIRSATIEAGALKAALGSVIGAIESRNTIPVLSNVALRFTPDHLVATGTNLDQQVSRQVPCRAQMSFETTVGAKLFKSMADKLPVGAEALIELRDARLIVTCGRARFELTTLPIEDFPDIALGGDVVCQFEMPGAELAAMIGHVRHAISTEETRFYLNGVFFERREAELIAVATDGHRLSVARRPAPDGSEPMSLGEALSKGVIVPRAVLPVLEPMLKEAQVGIALTATRVAIEAGEVTLISKLIDGTFPDWRRVVPSGNDKLLTVDPAMLKQAIERVSTICTDKTRAVKIAADSDRLTVSVTSPENGTAREEVSAGYDAAPTEFGANSRYLIDALSRISGDTVELHLADPAAPILIKAGGSVPDIGVLMPMRV